MTGRGAQTVVSLALTAVLGGCSTGYVEVPIETPIQPKLDVRPFSRVFVAGFLTAGTQDVDGNLETVRLLRSQLRNKGQLRVIDADALDLADVAGVEPTPAANGAAGAPPPQPAGDSQRRRRGPVRRRRQGLRRQGVLEEDRRGVPAAAHRHRHGALSPAIAQRLRPA